MGKSFKRRIAAFALAATLALSLTGTAVVFAGTIKTPAATEIFDANGINAKEWETVNNAGDKISVHDENGVAAFKDASLGTTLFTKKKTASPGAVVEFDMLSYNPTGWMTVVAGYELIGNPQGNYPLIQDRLLSSAGAGAFKNASGTASDWISLPATPFRARFTCGADGSMKIETAAITAGTAGAFAVLATADAGKFGPKLTEGTPDALKAGYVGIGFDGKKNVTIDNLSVYESDGKTLVTSSDFESTAAWKEAFALAADPAGTVKIGKVKSVLFDSPAADAKLLSKAELKIDPLTGNSVEIKFNANLYTLKDSKFALYLNAATGEDYLWFADNGTKTTAGFTKKGVAVGNAVELSSRPVGNDEAYYDFKVVVRANGDVKLYQGTALLGTFAVGKDLSGKIAFGSVPGSAEDAACKVYLKSCSADSYKYAAGDGKSVIENNFNSGYVNEDDWYMTSVGMPGTDGKLSVENGGLVFDRTSDGTFFGPKAKYSDFRVDFDLTGLVREGVEDEEGNILSPISTWFGIVFNKANLSDIWEGQSRMVYFSQATIEGINVMTAAGSTRVWDTINIWEKKYEQTVFHFSVVMENRTLSVYRRAEGEPFDKMDTPIAQYVDVDSDGYVTFATTAGGNLTLDNMRFYNLDASVEIPDEKAPAQTLSAPTAKLTGNTVSWDAVAGATGYVVTVNGEAGTKMTGTSFTLPATDPGKYRITVRAVGNGTETLDSAESAALTYEIFAEEPEVKGCGTVGLGGSAGLGLGLGMLALAGVSAMIFRKKRAQ